MASRTAAGWLACAVLLGLMAGCGDGGGEAGDRPTVTSSPTRTLPTRTPDRTDEATEEPTEEPTQEPSDRPTLRPSDRPTDDEPPEESEAAPPESNQPDQDESAAAGEAESAESDSDDDSVPSWVWWLLAAVVVAAAVLTWVLVVRSRRRRAWREQLQAAEAEVAWLARELLPQLRGTRSIDRVAGGWGVALPRVAAAEDQLTVLESSATDEADRTRARRLRDAVRDARARVESLTGAGLHDTWALDLDDAIASLEAALTPPPAETGRPPS